MIYLNQKEDISCFIKSTDDLFNAIKKNIAVYINERPFTDI